MTSVDLEGSFYRGFERKAAGETLAGQPRTELILRQASNRRPEDVGYRLKVGTSEANKRNEKTICRQESSEGDYRNLSLKR